MTETWPTVELAKLATVLSGFAFDSTKFSTEAGIPLVRIRDVSRGWSDTYFNGDCDPKFIVNDGDLLVGMDGQFNRELWRGGKALLNQRVCRVTSDGGNLDQRYLYHFLPQALRRIEDATPFVTVKHLSTPKVKGIQVPLPPLEEQRRIAAVLDQADELRGKRRATFVQLEALTHSIFIDMFGDPATNPKGWQRSALSSVVEHPNGIKCGPFGTQLGKSEYQTAGVSLWGIRQVNRQFALQTEEYLSEEKAKELAAYSLCSGDIVMTRKGTVGNCAVYPRHFQPGVMHSDLLRIRLNALADPTFMAFQLRHSREVSHQLSLISGGAVMPGINVSKLNTLQVLVPPLDLQRTFSKAVAEIDVLEGQTRNGLRLHDALFASLEYRAFRGEL